MAISPSTWAARILGFRSGALGAIVATSSAKAQPTAASSQRWRPWLGWGISVITMIDYTPACVIMI